MEALCSIYDICCIYIPYIRAGSSLPCLERDENLSGHRNNARNSTNALSTALNEKLRNEGIELGVSAESIDVLAGHLAVRLNLDTTDASEDQIRKAERIATEECVSYLRGTGKMPADFNRLLSAAIEDTIQEFLGLSMLEALESELRTKRDISSEELPYRLETVYDILENRFGLVGAETIGPTIAAKLYGKLGLPFQNHDGYSLPQYIRTAKLALSERILGSDHGGFSEITERPTQQRRKRSMTASSLPAKTTIPSWKIS
jgi:hypothetical protein